jgi:ADP-heptose:LPS heptosyltransferase
MTLRSKINIDRILGIPLISILNYIFLLFKRKNVHENVIIKNILVCKFMGMGSIIQSTPLIMTLKNNYPDSRITFLTVKKNYELLKTFPFVDQIITIDESSLLTIILTSFHSLWYLFTNRINVFIDLEIFSFFSKLFVPFSFAAYKIGFCKEASKAMSGIYSDVLPFNSNLPVKNVYLEIASLLECKNIIKDLFNYKNVTENSQNVPIQNLLPDLYNDDYIVINPNASELRIERRWPADYYILLINHIMDLYPSVKIVLTGSVDEQKYVDRIAGGIFEKYRSRIINTSGKLELNELIKLIDQSRLMITNDSGPMHIAFALNKMTIALFGPCSPVSYDDQINVGFVYKNIHCSPCVHDYLIPPCSGDNLCMKLINVSEVMNRVKNFLEKDLIDLSSAV